MKKYYFLLVINIVIIFVAAFNLLPDFTFKPFVVGFVSFPLAGILSDVILRILNLKPPKKSN